MWIIIIVTSGSPFSFNRGVTVKISSLVVVVVVVAVVILYVVKQLVVIVFIYHDFSERSDWLMFMNYFNLSFSRLELQTLPKMDCKSIIN